MLSVTNRIKTIAQPHGGYVPVKSLVTHKYDDGCTVDVDDPSYSAYASIQGTAIDYLTRFMCGMSKEKAFEISIKGAQLVGKESSAKKYLDLINGIDPNSIRAACKLVGFDVAFRRSPMFFVGTGSIKPSASIVNNIEIMVRRGVHFLESHKPVLDVGFTFEGGYTTLISSGDGDYLTQGGLWDFKVSKTAPNSSETLQVLTYYIMGLHSINPAFKHIKTLGLFNPLLNVSYEIDVAQISDLVFHQVSRNVIGYAVPDNPALWREISGEDELIIRQFVNRLQADFVDTGFDPNDYTDGIYNISVDDYWSYFRDKSSRAEPFRPKFNNTDHVKFLKNSGFIMFISVSPKGRLCILQGGFLRRLEKSVEYYYDMMPLYGQTVLNTFSKYWTTIYKISDLVKGVSPDTSNGRVHGCIVDIDYFNHIYLNPIDGTVVPYFAETMYQKTTYPNLATLISAQMPQFLPKFNKKIQKDEYALTLSNSSLLSTISALTSSEILQFNDVIYDTDMYFISNRLKILQLIYDYHLIAVWYEDILPKPKRISSPAIDKETDAEVSSNFNKYVSVRRDEWDISKDEHRFLLWSTKKGITQDELFAVIRIFLKENCEEMSIYKTINFGVSWSTKRDYLYVGVSSKPNEILNYYKSLFKERYKYQKEILLRFEVTEYRKRRYADVSVDFECINNPLALQGDFTYKNGELIKDDK